LIKVNSNQIQVNSSNDIPGKSTPLIFGCRRFRTQAVSYSLYRSFRAHQYK